ncbi:MAG: urea transporter [Cyclobacteriaceae bacterium]|nr:urea transporter [Cyclobacteriaceae bacterium]
MKPVLSYLRPLIGSIIFSYSQVFFSRNVYFAVLLILVTFFDPVTGMAGLVSVLAANFFAWTLGFDKQSIIHGDYGFNSLLVGLGLGILYNPSFPFFLLLIVASLSTFIFTIVVAGILSKYRLPYLSIPFLLAIWTFILASRNFETLTISARGVYKLNELFATGKNILVYSYQILNQIPLPEVIKVYFKSLGAILFQFNMLSGIIISVGLIIFSRIAFLLSLLSFILAYYFFTIMGADLNMLSYSYIGFNFILSGIALGAFYLIPSRESFLWTFLLIPVLLILTASLNSLFYSLQLSIYSLPFNIVVISFLYVLKLRFHPGKLAEVPVQHFQPEANLYHHVTGLRRFRFFRPLSIGLPVYGKWFVSQGYDGSITHRGDWKEAIDLVIKDAEGKTYEKAGILPEHYYCYDKPVVAPADGEVIDILNSVDDNRIGEVDLKNNWGNSLVIRHDAHLYSQISHLKLDSFKVKIGDRVKKGDILGRCGNSGRSPEPHIHFQVQSTPIIGSKTLEYPLSHFISEKNGSLTYHDFDYPLEGSLVQNVNPNKNLARAFHFLPGQLLKFKVHRMDGRNETEVWEVKTGPFNDTYLECLSRKAMAYFVQEDSVFYFTHFQGNRNCFLYYFFLGAWKVVFHSLEDLSVRDEIPLHLFTNSFSRYLYDFIAPFMSVMRVLYRSELIRNEEGKSKQSLHYHAEVGVWKAGKYNPEVNFHMEISEKSLVSFTIKQAKREWKVDYIK